MRARLLVAVAMVVAGCSSGVESEASSTTTTSDPPASASRCGSFGNGTPVGEVAGFREISGLVASRAHEGLLWVHEDSRHGPLITALATDGSQLGAVEVEGAPATDWEDIAIGPGPGPGDYIYVGDIGNNTGERLAVSVVRFPEPAPGDTVVTDWEELTFFFTDTARDAEALLVDPVTGEIIIVTKELSGRSRVFRADPAELAAPLREVGISELGVGQVVTGGDVAPDGSFILLRTYTSVLLWDRQAGSNVGETLLTDPCEVPSLSEPQGEAVGVAADGLSYFTVSEGDDPALNFFPAS